MKSHVLKLIGCLIITSMISNQSFGVIKYISPKANTDTIRLALSASSVANGDTFMMDAGTYIEKSAVAISKSITLMAKPGLNTKPLVNLQSGGITLTQEKISVTIQGIEFSGLKADGTIPDNFFYATGSSIDTFGIIKILDCTIRDYNRVFHLSYQGHFTCDSLIVDNIFLYHKTGTNFVFTFGDKAYPKVFLLQNSTFFDVAGGIIDNPRNNQSVRPAYTPKMKFIIHQNTFFNCVSAHRSFLQTEKISTPDSLTIIISNNILDKLMTPTATSSYAPNMTAPFRNFNTSSGSFSKASITFLNNSISNFDANPADATPDVNEALVYNIDSILKQPNVTGSNNILHIYPGFKDTTLLDDTPINLSLPVNSPLLTASSTGGVIGDPDWAPFQISISTSADTIKTDDGQLQYSVLYFPASAKKGVLWSIQELTGKASITANGLVTALKNGKVVVKAVSIINANVFSEDTLIIINQINKVNRITINGVSTTSLDKDVTFSADVQPDYADTSDVIWSVIGNQNGTAGSATIDPITGILHPISAGIVKVIATAKDAGKIIGEIFVNIVLNLKPVTSITITSENNATTISGYRDSLQLYAEVSPSDASDTTVKWSVVPSDKAILSKEGKLFALKNGTVTVKATANDGSEVFATKEIIISNQNRVTGITVNSSGNSSTIKVKGGTLQMEATILPDSADNKTLTWSVVKVTGTATISETGLLTAVTNGVVTVKATAKDGSGITGTKDITISNQNRVTGITISGAGNATAIKIKNGTLQMSAIVSPDSADNKNVTWSVENETGSASINETGLLTALTNGTVKVKATAKDGSEISGEIVITISGQAPVESISVAGTGGATTINTQNGTLQMIATVIPANADNPSVTWSVSDNALAEISETGLLSARANGKVKVIATSKENPTKKGEIEITISGQVGIADEAFAFVSVAPNPATSIIRIYVSQPVSVIISDITGKTKYTAQVEANGTLNIQSLQPGLYFLNIRCGELNKTIRLLKK